MPSFYQIKQILKTILRTLITIVIINSFIAREIFLRKRVYFPDEIDMAVAIKVNYTIPKEDWDFSYLIIKQYSSELFLNHLFHYHYF